MVKDETARVRALLPGDFEKALSALWFLGDYFGRETLSAGMGEISERLIAKYIGADRRRRSTLGHDLVAPDGKLVEVKARFISHYADTVQFNFSKHTEKADIAYCLAWISKSIRNRTLRPYTAFPFAC